MVHSFHALKHDMYYRLIRMNDMDIVANRSDIHTRAFAPYRDGRWSDVMIRRRSEEPNSIQILRDELDAKGFIPGASVMLPNQYVGYIHYSRYIIVRFWKQWVFMKSDDNGALEAQWNSAIEQGIPPPISIFHNGVGGMYFVSPRSPLYLFLHM
jgi:hypothetical protein